MDEKRQGEIALAYIRYLIDKNGIRLKPDDIQKNLAEISSNTGIALDEVKEFASILINNVVSRAI